MSHGIEDYAVDGMFWTQAEEALGYGSARRAPWHYNETKEAVTIFESWPTREEAFAAARHDFEVVRLPLVLATPFGLSDQVPGWGMLVRSDFPATSFQAVRDTYVPVQNTVGWDIVDALTSGNGHKLNLASGGTLKSGAVCWVCGYLDEAEQVPGDDSPIYPYLVVQWGHDGSVGINARTTTVRPECANTLSAGEAEAARSGHEFRFRHTEKVASRIEEAKRILTQASDDHARVMAELRELGLLQVTPEARSLFVTEFIPAPPETLVSDRVMANIEEARAAVTAILNGPTIPDAHRFTAYGLVQAGIEYLDYVRGYRNHSTLLGRTLLRPEPLKAKLVPMVRALASASS